MLVDKKSFLKNKKSAESQSSADQLPCSQKRGSKPVIESICFCSILRTVDCNRGIARIYRFHLGFDYIYIYKNLCIPFSVYIY